MWTFILDRMTAKKLQRTRFVKLPTEFSCWCIQKTGQSPKLKQKNKKIDGDHNNESRTIPVITKK